MTAGLGCVRRPSWAAGPGRVLAAPRERRVGRGAQTSEPAWGRFPAMPASKHVNKAWCVCGLGAAVARFCSPWQGLVTGTVEPALCRALPGVGCAGACSVESEGR